MNSSKHTADVDVEHLAYANALDELASESARITNYLRVQANGAYQQAGVREEEDSPRVDRPVDRILWNQGREVIDEIVIHNAMVHVEQMDDRCWWIGVYKPDGSRWSGNFSCDSRGRMRFTEQDAEILWDKDEEHRD